MDEIADWIERNAQSCPYKEDWGFECAGCGFQRAFVLLWRGEFADSFMLYPPLYFLLISLLITVAYIIGRNKFLLKAIPIAYTITLLAVIVNFIVKLSVN